MSGDRNVKKWIPTFCAWCAKIFAFGLVSLPRRWQLRLGDLLGVLWFDVLRIRRHLVLSNLHLAFPELTLAERKKLGRKSLCNMGRTALEFCYFPFIHPSNIDEHFDFFGLEKLTLAQLEGKGVCLLTCHLGAGDFGTAALSLKGFPIYLISKEFKFSWLNELWFGLRERLGTRFIQSRNSSFEILRALKSKAFVIFVQDQFMGPPIGARTTFFNIETGSALGLSVIARKTGAPILPVYTYRRDDGRGVIVIEDKLTWKEQESKESTLVHMTQAFNDKIEEMVRNHPEHWMWVHRRWKEFKH